MAGLVEAIVTGQHMALDTDSVITDAVGAAAAPTKAEFDAVVGKFNALLASLKADGLIKK